MFPLEDLLASFGPSFDFPPLSRPGEVRQEIRDAATELSRRHVRLAELLHEVHEREYWRQWGHKSFRVYVDQECGFGLRKAQQLIEFHRQFVIELAIPVAELTPIGWSKLALASSVINHDNKTELMAALKNKSFRELHRLIREIRLGMLTLEERDRFDGRVGSGPHVAVSHDEAPQDGSPPKPWALTLPDQTQFFVPVDAWEQLCFALHSGMNVLLTGPSGSGKSELCELAAKAAGRRFERFNFGAMSEPRASLIGNVHLDPTTGTRFVKSRFVQAIECPNTVVLVDELSRSQKEAFNIILPLLDRQRYIALDEEEHGSLALRAEGVCFFATANEGLAYTGTEALDAALKDRFPIQIAIDFPPPVREVELLVNRCAGLSYYHAERLVKLAARQREMAREGDFVGTVSTRALLAAGHQVAGGVSIANAVQFCVLNHFSAEGGETSERARLAQVFQKDHSLE